MLIVQQSVLGVLIEVIFGFGLVSEFCYGFIKKHVKNLLKIKRSSKIFPENFRVEK